MNLRGKTVLLTGASGGIGRMLAVRLGRLHANILLIGRDEVSLKDTLAAVVSAGGKADILIVDLLQATDRASVVEFCDNLPDGLYGLINNAGCNHFALLENQTETMIQNQINLNLLVPMLLTRALLPALRKQKGARILNIGSTFGSIGYPGYSGYCASKFGLRGFTESLRRENADSDMRILYLSPRATATKLNSDNVVAMNQELGNAMDQPDTVAAEAEKLFLNGSPNQVFFGWPEKLFARINQILPGVVDGALKKQLSVIKRFAD